MAIADRELRRAEARMETQRQASHAVSARYDRRSSRIIVALNTGVQIAFPADLAERLAGAAAADLAQIEISPAGFGPHWPRLDADLYVPSLLQGMQGSKSWMARPLGAAGGRARSQAKAVASRENGRKGGRPKEGCPWVITLRRPACARASLEPALTRSLRPVHIICTHLAR